MFNQNFGHKELYELVFRAKDPIQFGDRYIESQEPIMYFNDIEMSTLSEPSHPVFARGGWGNMPKVVWEDRSEVTFQLVDGVMSSIGMGLLFGTNILSEEKVTPLQINKREGPIRPEVSLEGKTYIDIQYFPIINVSKKVFIFKYDRKTIQKKIYGKIIQGVTDGFGNPVCRIELYEDKNCQIPAENNVDYLIDYYYEYRDKALNYCIQQERLNCLFTLEAKFYSKDENEGQNYTNYLYMPKVKIVSNVNLRLGERADPTVSAFTMIGLPETVGNQKNLIMEITRLSEDIDADI